MGGNVTRKAARASDSGFTLIEVMMALAILGIGLLSIAVAQITAIKVANTFTPPTAHNVARLCVSGELKPAAAKMVSA